MIEKPPSRRDAFSTLGGGLLAGMLSNPFCPSASANADVKADALMVDMHVHLVDSRLPGGLDVEIPLAPFGKDDAEGPKKLAETFGHAAKNIGMTHALCMPRCQISDKDPLGIRDTLAMSELITGLKIHPVGLAHPERFDRDHMDKVEAVLKEGKVKALKAYLGYFRYEPYSPGYRLYFELAAKYNVPVIFHCGDTFSRNSKVKYAHPLKIDEVAVDYPKTKFVIAHFGNPWLLDAAQVAYKNDNVWVDLSAILIGNAEAFKQKEKSGALGREIKRVKEAIEYTEVHTKFLYGSDWPLTPTTEYRNFVRKLFPERHHAAVFGDTAKELFGL